MREGGTEVIKLKVGEQEQVRMGGKPGESVLWESLPGVTNHPKS